MVNVSAGCVNSFKQNNLLVWSRLESRSLVGCCRSRLLGQARRGRGSWLVVRLYLRKKMNMLVRYFIILVSNVIRVYLLKNVCWLPFPQTVSSLVYSISGMFIVGRIFLIFCNEGKIKKTIFFQIFVNRFLKYSVSYFSFKVEIDPQLVVVCRNNFKIRIRRLD